MKPVAREVLTKVAKGAAKDAGGLPVALLGDFLEVLSKGVAVGKPLTGKQLATYGALAEDAARQGVALRALLDLYLSSAWRLWRHLPAVAAAHSDPERAVTAGEVMLHAVDDVAAALAEGYQLARRALVRAQEAARREFIDDLLSGHADVASVLTRAAGFGMDLSGPHAVAVIKADSPFEHTSPLVPSLERAILGSKGDAQALVAVKNDQLVVVFPAPDQAAVDHVVARLGKGLKPARDGWRMGVGASGSGVDGVVSSYGEGRDALELADRIGLAGSVVRARDLLVYRVLLRDQPALSALVVSALTPLLKARGGAGPLLQTLGAYFETGGNTAQTARVLHLSVRAVTYRLARVQQLTGHDVLVHDERLALQLAVVGARLLDWPGSLP